LRAFAFSVILAALHGALRYLTNEFARHGYAILFGLVAAESFWLPLPGELSLLAAGYEASHGKLDVFWVVGVGVAAAITGDNLAYVVGRLAGRPLIARLARLLHLHARRLDTMDHYFDRHAGKTIVTARWISPLRGLVALSAGATHVPWKRFFAFNAIGSVTWAATVTALAYGLSRSLGELADIFSLTGLVIGGMLIVGVVVILVWRHRRTAQALTVRQEAGPDGETSATPQPEVTPDEDCAATGLSEAGEECPVPAWEACADQAVEACSPASLQPEQDSPTLSAKTAAPKPTDP
jgi:membrane protein DedA with SNARE-associated domain